MTAPLAKNANHSELMKKLSSQSLGAPPLRCPHGCGEHDVDERGYCRHLVGFTVPGSPGLMEPRKPRVNAAGERTGYFVDGSDVRPVPGGATLDRITCSSRVYHPDGLPGTAPEPTDEELEAATRP